MAKRSRIEGEANELKSPRKREDFPVLTHLQFLSLELLNSSKEPIPAQVLNEAIRTFLPDYAGPKFYQLMERMIGSGLVTSEIRPIEVAGGIVNRTFYQPTADGRAAWHRSVTFYATRRQIAAMIEKRK
jgi:hypothetical protein